VLLGSNKFRVFESPISKFVLLFVAEFVLSLHFFIQLEVILLYIFEF